MPKVQLSEDKFTDGKIDIISLVFETGLATSKSEARRAITQGGVSVDGEKVSDITTTFDISKFENDGLVVKKGKKSFIRATV